MSNEYGRFYKGKFMIGLYDEEDNFIDVFDNAHTMAKQLNKKVATIYEYISAEKLHNIKKHQINGKWVQIKLIPIEEKEK